MDAETLIEIITLGGKIISGAAAVIAKGKIVMSETDAARIKAALAEAQAATTALRPRVDEALAAASKR